MTILKVTIRIAGLLTCAFMPLTMPMNIRPMTIRISLLREIWK